jgi:hypothetical protein
VSSFLIYKLGQISVYLILLAIPHAGYISQQNFTWLFRIGHTDLCGFSLLGRNQFKDKVNTTLRKATTKSKPINSHIRSPNQRTPVRKSNHSMTIAQPYTKPKPTKANPKIQSLNDHCTVIYKVQTHESQSENPITQWPLQSSKNIIQQHFVFQQSVTHKKWLLCYCLALKGDPHLVKTKDPLNSVGKFLKIRKRQPISTYTREQGAE